MPDPGASSFLDGDSTLPERVAAGLRHEVRRGRNFEAGDFSQAHEGGLAVAPPPRPPILGRITARNATDTSLYSFQQVFRDPTPPGGSFVQPPDAFAMIDAARDLNGNTSVPVGAVVRLWPSTGNYGQRFDFEYDAAGSATSPTYPAGSTVTVPQGATLSLSGTLVTPLPAPVTLSSPTYNNYPLPAGQGTVVLNPTVSGGVTLTGLAPPAPGQQVTVVNSSTTEDLVITTNDTSSSTSNQLSTTWGGSLVIPPCSSTQLQAGKGPGGQWGVLNPGTQPIPWQRPRPVIPMVGNLNDFNPGGFGLLQFNPQGGAFNLTGIKPPFPGAMLTVANTGTSGTLTLTNADVASSPGNQLALHGGTPVTLQPGQSLDLAVGAGGDFGTTENVNGPPAAAGGGAATLTHNTGATTASWLTVFDALNSNGFHGCLNIRNSGTSFGMQFKLTTTDMYNNVVSSTVNLSTGIITSIPLDSVVAGNSFPPFKELKLEVQDSTPGNHTTYDVYRAFVG